MKNSLKERFKQVPLGTVLRLKSTEKYHFLKIIFLRQESVKLDIFEHVKSQVDKF